jgi:hypothetical protein
LNFAKSVLSPLEPKLLVMWERIGEALKVVYGAYQFAETCISANMSGAIWCLALRLPYTILPIGAKGL